MRKLWVLGGIILIVFGLVSLSGQGWAFGEALPSFDRTWHADQGELRGLDVVSDYPLVVRFEKSDDGTNSVFLKARGREKMIEGLKSAEIEDGVLTLELRDRRGWFRLFDFGTGNDTEEVTVRLADGNLLERLTLKLDDGSLKVYDARVKEAAIEMDAGLVYLGNMSADRLSLEADSGSITADGLHADSEIRADSGMVKLEHVTGTTRLTVDSGIVKLYRDDTSNTEIEADSGSVYVQVPSSFAGYYDVKADSGIVHVPDSRRETEDYVKIRADSGSIRVEQGS